MENNKMCIFTAEGHIECIPQPREQPKQCPVQSPVQNKTEKPKEEKQPEWITYFDLGNIHNLGFVYKMK